MASRLRKDMRDGYAAASNGFIRAGFDGAQHEFALFGALNGWRILNNKHQCNMGTRLRLIGAEVAPFSAMDKLVSVDALAEYGVYLNLPKKSKTEWLAAQINAILSQHLGRELLYVVGQGLQEEIGWWGLVDPAIKQVVKTEGFLSAA